MEESMDLNEMKVEKHLALENRYDEITFPTLLQRIKAVFIDILILLLVFSASSVIIDLIGDVSNFIRGFILIFMVYLYDPVLTAFTGSTIGHKVMRLRVARYTTPDKRINFS